MTSKEEIGISRKRIKNGYTIVKQYGHNSQDYLNEELDREIVEDFAYIINRIDYKIMKFDSIGQMFDPEFHNALLTEKSKKKATITAKVDNR